MIKLSAEEQPCIWSSTSYPCIEPER